METETEEIASAEVENDFMTPAMKPCPFCGSVNLKVQTACNYYRFVCCRTCRAEGPFAHIKGSVACADKEAVSLWNRAERKPLD